MEPKTTTALKTKSSLYRSSEAKGLRKSTQTPVDRKGGDYGQGIIRGASVLTRGEALGHGMWVDGEMVRQAVNALNSAFRGIKARFTHPGLSADGLGTYLGRWKGGSVDGDSARSDLHFSKLAHATPDGDLAEYTMGLAESDPDAFGTSIVFRRDVEAEQAYMLANGGRIVQGEYGQYIADFKSPDPLNTENLPHARIKELRACDCVDSPAANPNGLFHRGAELAEEAEQVISYALNLRSDPPEVDAFDIDPDRVRRFVQSYLDRRSLVVTTKGQSMPDESTPETPAQANEPETAALSEQPEIPGKPEEKPAESEGARFLAAFGDKGGVWYAQGKTYDEACLLCIADLRAELDKSREEAAGLRKQAEALRGEARPLSFEPEQTKEQKLAADKSQNLGAGLGKFAAGIVFKK